MDPFNENLQHLVRLWKNAMFRQHAELRARELEADDSGVFRGILAQFQQQTQALRGAVEALVSPSPESPSAKVDPLPARPSSAAARPPSASARPRRR